MARLVQIERLMAAFDDREFVDRHDLDALKELMQSEFRGVEKTLSGMAEALHVAAGERKQKDAELNEVRLRFVDRITFEQYKEAQERALDAALLSVTAKLDALEGFRSKAMGFGALLAIIAGVVGAVIQRAVA